MAELSSIERATEALQDIVIDWENKSVEYNGEIFKYSINGRLAMSSNDGVRWVVEPWFEPLMNISRVLLVREMFKAGY